MRVLDGVFLALRAYLQPFEDVNKRVSRLAANIPLVQRNLGPLSFVDVPQSDQLRSLPAAAVRVCGVAKSLAMSQTFPLATVR